MLRRRDKDSNAQGGNSASNGGNTSQGGATVASAGGAAGTANPNVPCSLPAPRVVLLTPAQYENTLAVVLPGAGRVADLLSSTLGGGSDFSNDSTVQRLSSPHVENLFETARGAATKLSGSALVSSCLLGAAPDQVCVGGFVKNFGQAAFRRPLAQDEIDKASSRYQNFRKTLSAGDSLSALIRTFLMSPYFIYRTELPSQPSTAKGVVDLSSYDRASAISYTITDGPPDSALLQAAQNNQLATADGVAQHVRRLLGASNTAVGVKNLFLELFKYDQILETSKDPKVLSDDSLRDLMRLETEGFVNQVLWNEDANISTLLGADFSWLNGKLAAFYGVPGVAAASPFAKVKFPAGFNRAGLLTHGSLLGVMAGSTTSSPVIRGKFIRGQLLCQQTPDPPPDVVVTPLEDDGKSTARQRHAMHNQPKCTGCHALMDPLGLAFENFDAIGRYRQTENNLPIDASVKLTETSMDGDFKGPAELARALGRTKEAKQCFAEKLFSYALARTGHPADRCGLERLTATASVESGNLREILVSVLTADSFLRREVAQ
jgi:hypothetical protein